MADSKKLTEEEQEELDLGLGAGASAAGTEEEEGDLGYTPGPVAKPGPVDLAAPSALPPLPSRRTPAQKANSKRGDLAAAVLERDEKIAEKDRELAEAREKLAAAERRLSQRGTRKPGHTSYSNLGRHEADEARIRANRIARGEDPDAPMYVRRKDLDAAYARFSKNTKLTPNMQPQQGQDKIQAPQRVGRRVDKTE